MFKLTDEQKAYFKPDVWQNVEIHADRIILWDVSRKRNRKSEALIFDSRGCVVREILYNSNDETREYLVFGSDRNVREIYS